MLMSRLFSTTLREIPADADSRGHRLLLRAGFIRQVAAGIYALLPLGLAAMRRIEGIIRDEMEPLGAQEGLMPVVIPGSLWRETGRWDAIDAELVRFTDRWGREMALAVTHEEVATDIARREISSYRQLPQLFFHFQTKVRDDLRPRSGLIRTREFVMKDAYSFDRDETSMRTTYAAMRRSYERIFSRCGLDGVIAVGSDTGIMGGAQAHEFMYLSPLGEDRLAICSECGDANNREVAPFVKNLRPIEPAADLEVILTPEATTIEAVCAAIGCASDQTAKTVFFETTVDGDAQVVVAMVRGDMTVNEVKLARAIGSSTLFAASDAAIRGIGSEPGFASPVGIRRTGTIVVLDDALVQSSNLVAGANARGKHWRNVNFPRDATPDVVADIAMATDGSRCRRCSGPLRVARAVEVGHIFQLGTRYSEPMGATFVDADGTPRPLVMGSYGIGLGRLLACIAEEHSDDAGLRLPVAIAPHTVHIVRVGRASEVATAATELVRALDAAGVPAIDDDRDRGVGVKLADADLLGAPMRVIVSARSLAAGGVEIRPRDDETRPTVVDLRAAVRAAIALARYDPPAPVESQ